jgi:DNA-binding MarR family transcriptional regulator
MVERALEDMTLPQFRVLLLIASSPERASRVAEKAAVSRPSLTGLLDGLEQRGWVRRAGVDGDRRGVSLEVTPAGNAALRDAQAATVDRLQHILAELPRPERDDVLRGLATLSDAFAAARAAGAAEAAGRARP